MFPLIVTLRPNKYMKVMDKCDNELASDSSESKIRIMDQNGPETMSEIVGP